MAVLFKIILALFAFIALTSGVEQAGANNQSTHDVDHSAHATDIKDAVAGVETAKDLSTIVEAAHHRHKRGCKTITYKKGGRTITAQKC